MEGVPGGGHSARAPRPGRNHRTSAGEPCRHHFPGLVVSDQRHRRSSADVLDAADAGLLVVLVSAALAIAAGIILLARPVQGTLTLTIVVGAYFLAEGIATIMYALEHRRELSQRWSWLLVAGLMDILIALIIVAGLPGSAEWAIGLLVGINLVLGGASLVGMALAARNS